MANNAIRAPKQWSLSKDETITSFESWRQNLKYVLSLDPNFATFAQDGAEWEKKTRANPARGLVDDAPEVDERQRRTAAQKVIHLELMLGQIANYCPIISRNTIVKNSTSLDNVWQAIRAHFGFQTTGAHFIDFADIKLKPGERPEDLYQRIVAFVEDNLLTVDSDIEHHGEDLEEDEEMTPMVENMIVLTWLRLVHPDLPGLVKQRYGTELRNSTLASIKPEISQAMTSLLETLNSSEDARVMRSAPFNKHQQGSRNFQPRRFNNNNSNTNNGNSHNNNNNRTSPTQSKQCPLCVSAGRTSSHYLSQCNFLPAADKKFIAKARLLTIMDDTDPSEHEGLAENEDEDYKYHLDDVRSRQVTVVNRRVQVCKSPTLHMMFRTYSVPVLLDSGGETNMIQESVALRIGAVIKATNQCARQADGVSPLSVKGETSFTLHYEKKSFQFNGLVVEQLDVGILAGMPFMIANDITLRPSKSLVIFSDGSTCKYQDTSANRPPTHSMRRVTSHILRAPPTNTTLYPGDHIDVEVPEDLHGLTELALEPRVNNSPLPQLWPNPSIVAPVCGRVRITNDTDTPLFLKKNEQFGQLHATTPLDWDTIPNPVKIYNVKSSIHDKITEKSATKLKSRPTFSDISVDPNNLLPADIVSKFHAVNARFKNVFNTKDKLYNGAFGHLEAVVNMGPSLPPQRKGRVPQYSRDKLVELQDHFDEMEENGVIVPPDEVGVIAEYLNPSFLIKKPSGSFRLVTSFGEVAKYAKPQPALMPDVNDTLRLIGTWKYIVKTDLSSAYYQIPLSKDSMKFCGVCTPFKGVRVYARPSMGMPGSETALEQMMSLVVGNLVAEGVMAKVADDLFVGGETPEQLLDNYTRMLSALEKANLGLSPAKTQISPSSTTILGWIWTNGTLSASPHRIASLSSCAFPTTVKQMRSFIGAYKFLSRVIPRSSDILSALEDSVAGKPSSEKLSQTEALQDSFAKAQKFLSSTKTITIPKPDDQLWIVTDGAMQPQGLGSALYVTRNDQLHLSGHFSAKLKDRQNDWIPCEIEALCIAASIKHFSPYITQSTKTTCVMTDSKPCVQAYDKLCRGEFSNSSRVTTFLSVASRYPLHIRHLKGSVNLPADFASRNAPECHNPNCQVCSFIKNMTTATVHKVTVQDIQAGSSTMPFTTRSTWLASQNEDADLRRVKAQLQQGTRPSKKLTNCRDVKRYLNIAAISRDGLLVVQQQRAFQASAERIIIPRQLAAGLYTALHIRLDHPTHSQLKQVTTRYFFSLDMEKDLQLVASNCHTCSSLAKLTHPSHASSTSLPPPRIGSSFAADIVKCNRQLILLLRETVSSYTLACLVEDEKGATVRDGLIQLCVPLRPLDGPAAVIRVDPAPGFNSLKNDPLLASHRLRVEVGEAKNKNKNPIAEKAVQEFEDELLRQDPERVQVTSAQLAVVIAGLNSRIRNQGLSSREIWTQRDQFSHDQLPLLSDEQYITQQYKNRQRDHRFQPASFKTDNQISVGDLVYLYADKDKTHSHPRYMVSAIDQEWCFLRKFVGKQLRHNAYKVHRDDCFKITESGDSRSASRDGRRLRSGQSFVPVQFSDPIDEIPTQITSAEEAVPALEISAPLAPSVPVEISEPLDAVLDENVTEIASPESNIQDLQSSPNQHVVPSPPSVQTRVGRLRRPPSYLKDFDCS